MGVLSSRAFRAVRNPTHPSPESAPRLTVVVVCLDEGEQVARTVACLRATSPPNTEIIVCDDGSTDGSTAFVDGRDPWTRLSRTERSGVARARNRGARAGTADIVVFTDGHIATPPEWWVPMVAALERPEVGAVGPAVSDMADRHCVGYGLHLAMPSLTPGFLGRRREEAYPVPILPGCCWSMRREVFEAVGGFDEGLVHWGMVDAEMAVRLWLLGYELQLEPDVDVAHLFRPMLPYDVAPGSVVHNKLRLAQIHFSDPRAAEVADALSVDDDFDAALALLDANDIAERRRHYAARRQRTDDWLFERFEEFAEER
jgi:glycosyltransferase involved in cell wall biosynthesis